MTECRSIPESTSPVSGDEVLWRRIPLNPVQVVRDSDTGNVRPSSAAFEIPSPPNGCSVDRASIALNPAATLAGARGPSALAAVTAQQVRDLGLKVEPDPDPGNPAHALIVADSNSTPSQRKRLASKVAQASNWVVPPPDSQTTE